MARFLHLTLLLSNRKVAVNINHIITILPAADGGSIITTTEDGTHGNHEIVVLESFDKIIGSLPN